MSIKKWNVKFQVFFDASKNISINVEANTERKAKLKAIEKIKKEYNCKFPILLSIKQYENSGVN